MDTSSQISRICVSELCDKASTFREYTPYSGLYRGPVPLCLDGLPCESVDSLLECFVEQEYNEVPLLEVTLASQVNYDRDAPAEEDSVNSIELLELLAVYESSG